VFFEAFLYLQFDFVISRQKNIGAKAAHKVLIKKFTTGLIPSSFFEQLLR